MKMWKQTLVRSIGIGLTIGILAISSIAFEVYAQTPPPTHTSPNYGVDEVFFGSGGVNDANSASYNARASLGDLGVGNSASANFQAYGGFTTTDEPFIEFVVNSANVDLGVLNNTLGSTGSATFTIRTWLAHGYVITTASDPPQNGSYTMTNLATPTSPSTDTSVEQFGINLRANTDPAAVGADPVQLPDASFSYGQVAIDYNTPDQYTYNKGDTVAYSSQSTSITQYTISYLMKSKTTTPGGVYVMNHNLVATSTF